ncbi:hypothetical protein AALA98_15150 [Lachnospiraceae bacterium 45-W7]
MAFQQDIYSPWKKGAVSEFSPVHPACDNIPHIRRPIHFDCPTGKTTLRRQLDALFDTFTFDNSELTIIAGTAQGICKAKEPEV